MQKINYVGQNDVYNELNSYKRRSAEAKASPDEFFNKTGNPFFGFMRFLQRRPVPPKHIDEQRLMADFAEYAKEQNKIGKLVIVMAVFMILSFMLMETNAIFGLIGFPVMVIVIIILFVVIGKSKRSNRYYDINDYKAYVINKAVSSEVEELVFEPNFGLPLSVFKDIKIIRNGNRYHTEDLITGKFHGVYFVQSDLNVEYKGDKQSTTYFKGRWIAVDYPKPFTGTVIIIDSNFKYSLKRKDLDKIELENPEFNSMFTVKSSDMQLAYYLLTPQIMERLMYLKQNSRGHIVACFNNGILHIGINNNQNSFEPNIKNINLANDVQKFRYDFSLVSGLIEILKIDNNVYVQQSEPQILYQQNNFPNNSGNGSGTHIQGGF